MGTLSISPSVSAHGSSMGSVNPSDTLGLHALEGASRLVRTCFRAYFGVTGWDESSFQETVAQAVCYAVGEATS